MTLRAVWAALAASAVLVILGLALNGSTQATEPNGVLSLDADTTGNTASAVTTIEATNNSVADAACNSGAGITVALVIGNAGSSDPGGSGGIPSNRDIGGWQANIVFDGSIISFKGHTVSNAVPGAEFYMEKASDHDEDIGQNNHIKVSSPSADPTGSSSGTGAYTIGSAILNTPPGAEGVGRLAHLNFDCLQAGQAPAGVCISIVVGGDTFYSGTNPPPDNHDFIPGALAVGLGINGGTAPVCVAVTPSPSPTPFPTAPPPSITATPAPTPAKTATPTAKPASRVGVPTTGGEGPGGDSLGMLLIAAGIGLGAITAGSVGVGRWRRKRGEQ